MPAAIAPFAVRLYFMSARVLRRADGHNLPCRMFVKYTYFQYLCIWKLRKECNLLEMSVG